MERAMLRKVVNHANEMLEDEGSRKTVKT